MEDLYAEYIERSKRGETFAGEYSIISRLMYAQLLLDDIKRICEAHLPTIPHPHESE